MELKGFGRPFCVQRNKKGELFVGDFKTGKVTMYDKDLNKIKELSGPFSGPHSISLDGDENIYVNDYNQKKVYRFDPKGETLGGVILSSDLLGPHLHAKMPFLLSGPAMTHIDPKGNLIVSDYGSCSLQKFSGETHRFLGWLGIDAEGKFHAWDKEGAPVTSSLHGGFDRVHSVAFDRDENMIVVDTWNHRLQKFDKDGNFLQLMPGFFEVPVSIDLEGDRFVVSECGSNQIQCFDLKGKQLWVKKGYNHPYDVKIKGKTLIVADSDNRRIVVEEI